MKLKSYFTILGVLLFLTSVGACDEVTFPGNDEVIKEKRSVADFSELVTNGGFDIELKQGETNKLQVQAPERYIDDLLTVVEGNKLVIKMREGVTVNQFKNFKVWLTFKTLNKLTANGAADINAEDWLDLSAFSIVINGAADIELPLRCRRLEANINGAGDLNFEGNANVADISIAGAGDLNSLDLEVKKMEISLSGAGSAKVYVTGHLEASISGVGSIRYKGNPTLKKHDGSIFGSIKPY